MGFHLWYSEQTKISRRGTSFSELQEIFIENITTKYIYEPLACCRITDNPIEVQRVLKQRDFDTLGVINKTGTKIGYIEGNKLGDDNIEKYLQKFELEIIISDSTPLAELFEILLDKEFVYILSKGAIEGIVTRADINKPIVRIYLFGLISLYELHLNFWITKNYDQETWKQKLSPARLETAENIFEIRKGNNIQLSLLECIQFCDKREILKKTRDFITEFDYIRKDFEKLLKNVEIIRNELAHSQNSIIANLNWVDFVHSIKMIKEFLEKSEVKIKA